MYLSLVLLIVVEIAGVFAISGPAEEAGKSAHSSSGSGTASVLFVVFLILFFISLFSKRLKWPKNTQ